MVGRDEFDFAGKRIVILGLARQGSALARFFVGRGARVVVSDVAPAEGLQSEIKALAALPVELALGGHPATLLDGCDLLCLSGGVPPQIDLVQTAIARCIRLSNDSLLTLQLARRQGLGPLIAITGSSGKTTTTTLVGRMLAAAGKKVHVGGNIGTPLIDRLESVAPGDPIVLELSSFQLELFNPALAWGDLTGSGPDVAAILNVTPNHLDRHASMREYAAAKFNLLRHMPAGARVVLNADDAVTGQVAAGEGQVAVTGLPDGWQVEAAVADAQASIAHSSAAIVRFSMKQSSSSDAWLDGETLVYHGQPFARQSEVKLRGDHNISNLLAAAAISGAAGVEPAAMRQVATTFAGVPHRLEMITAAGNIVWINDSIATSPERAVAALRSFEPGRQTLILLAGGKNKNLPWERFAEEVIERVNYLIAFGEAGPMIVNTLQDHARYLRRPAPNTAVVQRLDEAVELAARVAQSSSRCGNTVILLSPGGTSYDAYKDFEARGAHFRQLVAKWTESNGE